MTTISLKMIKVKIVVIFSVAQLVLQQLLISQLRGFFVAGDKSRALWANIKKPTEI
jgi:hypothetical protein